MTFFETPSTPIPTPKLLPFPLSLFRAFMTVGIGYMYTELIFIFSQRDPDAALYAAYAHAALTVGLWLSIVWPKATHRWFKTLGAFANIVLFLAELMHIHGFLFSRNTLWRVATMIFIPIFFYAAYMFVEYGRWLYHQQAEQEL